MTGALDIVNYSYDDDIYIVEPLDAITTIPVTPYVAMFTPLNYC